MEFSGKYLPEELVYWEILVRLPVKVLVRFKCVQTPWRDLIESQDFVEQHFKHEANQQRLLVRLEAPLPHRDRYTHALYVDDSFSEYEEPPHLQIPGPGTDFSYLLGPLNGIFCVNSCRPLGPMGLLNPAMRQFKPLPMIEGFHPNTRNAIALGFDPLTRDYKVVVILHLFECEEEEHHCVVHVCPSSSGVWRVLEDVDPIVANSHAQSSLCCTYLNGVYYWLATSRCSPFEKFVLALDMSTERFQAIPLTLIEDDELSGRMHLALCGESLALLISRFELGTIDVWIMENEGLHWRRSSGIGPSWEIEYPICFWKENELLIETSGSLMALHDMSTKKTRKFGDSKERWNYFGCWYFVYKESLVSIQGETGCLFWDVSSKEILNFLVDDLW